MRGCLLAQFFCYATALKLKIAHPAGAKQKILELSFLLPLLRVLEFPS
nr:hypothetical protein [uncultured Campylobacter sp.]